MCRSSFKVHTGPKFCEKYFPEICLFKAYKNFQTEAPPPGDISYLIGFFAQFWPTVCDTTLFSLLVPIIHLVVLKATAAAVGIEPFETLLKAAERQTFFP